MKKKIIACLLAIASLASLAACKKEDPETAGMTKVTLMFSENGGAPYDKDWLILKEIRERKNVNLELQVIPGSDFATKKSVAFASGELPDLIANCWPNEMSQYASTGILLPVSDYVDKLPNLKEIMETWDLEATIKDISEANGKFYVFPSFSETNVGTLTFMIRKDIFDAAGLDVPTTYAELAEDLKVLKEKYPDSLGLGDMFNGDCFFAFVASSFNTKGGWSLPNGYSYHPETDEWYFAPTSDEYKTMLQFFNQMYNDGTLDAEGFTQDSSTYDQKILTNKYFVFSGNGYNEAISKQNEIIAAGTEGAEVIPILPLAGPTGLAKTKPGARSGEGVAMPAKSGDRDDFDKVLDFCDWLFYSEDGAILTNHGVEGVTFDIVDGEVIYKDNIRTTLNPNGELGLSENFGMSQMGMRTLAGDRLSDEYKYAASLPEDKEFREKMLAGDFGVADDPILKFTAEQLERSRMLVTNLNDYTGTMMLKFIYGQESFDNWDTYVQECEKKGASELIEIVTEAWEAHK